MGRHHDVGRGWIVNGHALENIAGGFHKQVIGPHADAGTDADVPTRDGQRPLGHRAHSHPPYGPLQRQRRSAGACIHNASAIAADGNEAGGIERHIDRVVGRQRAAVERECYSSRARHSTQATVGGNLQGARIDRHHAGEGVHTGQGPGARILLGQGSSARTDDAGHAAALGASKGKVLA